MSCSTAGTCSTGACSARSSRSARANGVGVMAYGSLAYGMLSGTFHEDMQFDETDWRSKRGTLGGLNLFRTLFGPDHFPRNLARGRGSSRRWRPSTARPCRNSRCAGRLSQPVVHTGAGRVPPPGRGGGKSRRARLHDFGRGHGRDRRDLRPQRRRDGAAGLAGGRSASRGRRQQSMEEAPCRFNASRR